MIVLHYNKHYRLYLIQLNIIGSHFLYMLPPIHNEEEDTFHLMHKEAISRVG